MKDPWMNNVNNHYHLEHNLAYKTKEEAIEAANKMLEIWKER